MAPAAYTHMGFTVARPPGTGLDGFKAAGMSRMEGSRCPRAAERYEGHGEGAAQGTLCLRTRV